MHLKAQAFAVTVTTLICYLNNVCLVFSAESMYTLTVNCKNAGRGGVFMSAAEIERSIQTATMSLAMEGLVVGEQYVELCRKMLSGEISMKEYLATVIEKVKD